MKLEVQNSGAFASLHVTLAPGETVQAESDAMVTRSGDVDLKGRMQGGLFGSLTRLFAAGESMFLQELTAGSKGGDAVFAAKLPGDIAVHTLTSTALCIRNGAFLACTTGVEVTTTTQSGKQFLLKSGFSGQGMFIIRCTGAGKKVAISSCGSLTHYKLRSGEQRVIDNDHVVAWTENMDYDIKFQSQSLWHSASSGEGLGMYFTGPGEVYVQSHAPSSFSSADDSQGKTLAHPHYAGSSLRWCMCFGVILCIVSLLVGLGVMSWQDAFDMANALLSDGDDSGSSAERPSKRRRLT